MAALTKAEARTLEIKTKSIEQTLIPLVTQISTLVNAKEKPIKSEKTIGAIVQVGYNVNQAVHSFVLVGEAIADDNQEIGIEMYEACKDARAAGVMIEQLCDSQLQEYGQHRSYTDKNNMVRAARGLLSSVTRVLLLADTVVVKQLEDVKERVSLTLNSLENASNFTEFVKAFSQFGNEMVQLAHLTGDRQNDLKNERRKSEMAVARQILERSTMLLLTSSKAFFKHPDSLSARENRDAIFFHMRKAIDLIYFVVRDGICVDLPIETKTLSNGTEFNTAYLWDIEELDQCNTAHNAIISFQGITEMIRMTLVGPPYRERLTNALDIVVERTQDFTDSAYTSHAHREKILLLCDQMKLELKQLLRIGIALDQAGCTSPDEDLENSVHGILYAIKDLKEELQDTALEQTEDLIKMLESSAVTNGLRASACTADQEKLDEFCEKFTEYAEHVHDASKLLHHVASQESLQVATKNIEMGIKVFGTQVLNACQTVCLRPHCDVAKENLDVFLEVWHSLCKDLISIAREISDSYRGHVQDKTVYMSLPRPGRHGTTSKQLKPLKLDVEEQAKIAKLGLEMKLLTSEIDAETDKWQCAENDVVRRARNMSQMAFSMYQFTRGEGDLKTTQDLFTKAEFFADEANKLYKLVRQFSYQVPGGQQKNELLELLDQVPTFVQQLQFTVKNPTVGKAATFTKVDNVIQETKNLMNIISKVVTTCHLCATKFCLDFQSLNRKSQNSPYKNELEKFAYADGHVATAVSCTNVCQSNSEPNV